MIYFFNSILIQASVLGDLKAERGGEPMIDWGIPSGVIIAIIILYFVFRKND